MRLSSIRKAMFDSGWPFLWPGKTKAETRAFSISFTISTALGDSGTSKDSFRCSRSFRFASGTFQSALSKSNSGHLA